MTVAQLKPQPIPPKVDPTKEYVAGSGFWAPSIAQVLSNFTDDIETLISWDVYERMARDPVVSKNIQYQKLSVSCEGVDLHPVVTDETDPEFAKAQEIVEFERRNLAGLHRPVTQIIDEMMVALKRGHSVAEITYKEPSSTGVDANRLRLESIKVKPRNTTAFVVDQFRNVLGLTTWNYGPISLVATNVLPGNQQIIPREKFAVLTFETEDEDPRGINVLRPAYNFWQAKCLVPPMHLQWLDKSGLPSTVGTTPQGAQYEQVLDANGSPTSEVQSPEEAMARTLAKLKSGSTAVFPYGATVKSIEVAGNGSQFTRCYEDFNREIDYALSLQSGATKDSKTGSYSSKRVFKDVLDILIWSRKHRVSQVIYNDVLKNDVIYNFGKEYVHLTPIVRIGDEEGRDWALDAAALARLAPSLTDSQWDFLCAELGIPAPLADEVRPSRVHVIASQAVDNQPDGAIDGGLQ